MQVITALLVDEVKKHPDGRVDLLGLFEDIYLDELPVRLDALSLFVDLALADADRGRTHTLEFRLVDAAGAARQEGSKVRFTIPPLAEFGRDSAQLDLVLFEQTFHAFGTHYVEVRLGDAVLRRVPLYVNPREVDGR